LKVIKELDLGNNWRLAEWHLDRMLPTPNCVICSAFYVFWLHGE